MPDLTTLPPADARTHSQADGAARAGAWATAHRDAAIIAAALVVFEWLLWIISPPPDIRPPLPDDLAFDSFVPLRQAMLAQAADSAPILVGIGAAGLTVLWALALRGRRLRQAASASLVIGCALTALQAQVLVMRGERESAVLYRDLLPTLSHDVGAARQVTVLIDTTQDVLLDERLNILHTFQRCYPFGQNATTYFDLYTVTASDLAHPTCRSAGLNVVPPPTLIEGGATTIPIEWSLDSVSASRSELACRRARSDIVWIEGESFGERLGWVAVAIARRPDAGRRPAADPTQPAVRPVGGSVYGTVPGFNRAVDRSQFRSTPGRSLAAGVTNAWAERRADTRSVRDSPRARALSLRGHRQRRRETGRRDRRRRYHIRSDSHQRDAMTADGKWLMAYRVSLLH